MKKFIACALITSLSPFCFSQQANYTEGNSNPYVRYEFKTAEEWSQIAKMKKESQASSININYFNNSIQSPLKISGKNTYKHLMANAEQISGCWDKAATIYKVDPWLLMAIAKTESSFDSKATNVNKNKSVDMGMMQINSMWLPTLKKFGINSNHLFNPCTSIFVGAWIVAQNIQHFGYNQDGIGAYNSPGNITIRRNYAQKVYASYRQLVQDFHVAKQ